MNIPLFQQVEPFLPKPSEASLSESAGRLAGALERLRPICAGPMVACERKLLWFYENEIAAVDRLIASDGPAALVARFGEKRLYPHILNPLEFGPVERKPFVTVEEPPFGEKGRLLLLTRFGPARDGFASIQWCERSVTFALDERGEADLLGLIDRLTLRRMIVPGIEELQRLHLWSGDITALTCAATHYTSANPGGPGMWLRLAFEITPPQLHEHPLHVRADIDQRGRCISAVWDPALASPFYDGHQQRVVMLSPSEVDALAKFINETLVHYGADQRPVWRADWYGGVRRN